jgi:anti-sigma regulatory factor (Ser/Thr protein kinase)
MQHTDRHEAVPYAGHSEFVSSCVSLVREHLAADERLILLAAEAKLGDVRDALGPDGEDVAFVPTDEHGRNPARITTLLDSFQAAGDGRHGVGINESVFVARSSAAFVEAQLAESVLNARRLHSWPLSIVCLYDRSELDDASLAEMRRSHPAIRGQEVNPAYDPDRAGALFGAALPEPPAHAETIEIMATDLAAARAFVRVHAASVELAVDRADDLVLAANEIVTNSLRHGGGRCRLTVWPDDAAMACEVRDEGHIEDPLLGRLAPPPTAASGRGLWLANHLCDLVQIRSSQAGTVVRLFVDS